jgi:integrase
MAQVYKRPNSPFYYGKFQHEGKVHRFSTGETTKKNALAKLNTRRAAARREQHATDMLDHALAAIQELPVAEQDKLRRHGVRRLQQGQKASVLVTSAWDAWLSNPKRRNQGESTLAGYSAIWRRFASWISDHEVDIQALHEATEATVEAYATNLWDSGVSPRTYNAHISFLRSMFGALSSRAGLGENVWESVPRMQVDTCGKRDLTVKELKKIVDSAEGSMKAMILLGVYTGMRLGDACTLSWSSVNLRDRVIDYVPRKTMRLGKAVRVPIHKELLKALRSRKKGAKGDQVFPEHAQLYQSDRTAVSKQFQQHFESNGIRTVDETKPKHRQRVVVRVGFHSLRHSFVSLCAAKGVPQVALMELVGHGSPSMTRVYSHSGDAQKKTAIDSLPSLAP